MINLNDIVRPNILNLTPYSSARDEFTGEQGVFLDANENPFGKLNRYPDPYQKKLKEKLAQLKGVNTNTIFVGNGSDEIIDLAFRIFCRPGLDKAIIFSPTYGMYAVSAAINDVKLVELPLQSNFQIDIKKLESHLNDTSIKLMFICSPNNPTGNLINEETIAFILNNFNGIVVVDEAYIDFSKTNSLVKLINKYNNLIVSQTFSKAWGLAAVRIGTAYANKEIIQLYNNVKPPYNVSEINQQEAIKALEDFDTYKENLNLILAEKERLIHELQQINFVKNIYPSDANFLLVKVNNADQVYMQLVNQQIIIRNRNAQVANCIRISVGTPKENTQLLNALKRLS